MLTEMELNQDVMLKVRADSISDLHTAVKTFPPDIEASQREQALLGLLVFKESLMLFFVINYTKLIILGF